MNKDNLIPGWGAFGEAISYEDSWEEEEEEDNFSFEDKKLTAKGRKHIKESNFALPGRRYPIHDEAHGRAALQMVAKHGTPSEKKKVRAAVRKKYPNIGKKK